MDLRKIVAALAVSLGLAASAANAAAPQQQTPGYTPEANGGLFQMNEVNANGAPVAAGDDEAKCGSGSCGAAKPEEHKCGAGSCGKEEDVNDKGGDDAKCGAGSCGAGEKGDEAKCGGSSCGAKNDDKGDDAKCGGSSCGAAH